MPHINHFSETANWYAVYTRPHHEKKVCRKLQEIKLTVYLPLQITLRQWSDRKKKVTIPVFNCYVFVNVTAREYDKVLNIPGVIRYVAFEGKAVPIPEHQIRMIRNILEQELELEEFPENLHEGVKIRITAGPLTGISGELVDFSGKKRVIIRIEEINKSLLVSVPMYMLQLAS
jgi:transcriptional antiterminator RfaH